MVLPFTLKETIKRRRMIGFLLFKLIFIRYHISLSFIIINAIANRIGHWPSEQSVYIVLALFGVKIEFENEYFLFKFEFNFNALFGGARNCTKHTQRTILSFFTTHASLFCFCLRQRVVNTQM
jgi:hypothetical protein